VGGNVKERYHLEELDVYGRVIFKWVFNKYLVGVGEDWIDMPQNRDGGRVHRTEPEWGFCKTGDFLSRWGPIYVPLQVLWRLPLTRMLCCRCAEERTQSCDRRQCGEQISTVAWLMRLISLWRPEFAPRAVHMGFLSHRIEQGQFCLRILAIRFCSCHIVGASCYSLNPGIDSGPVGGGGDTVRQTARHGNKKQRHNSVQYRKYKIKTCQSTGVLSCVKYL
jgi:hypothetical protein